MTNPLETSKISTRQTFWVSCMSIRCRDVILKPRKFIPAEFLNGPIRESLYSRKLILALGDRESLSPRNLLPAKAYTF